MRHLKNFELIEAVVRFGSIRKAAEESNITASALNRRLHQFEEDFGAQIFERLPSGMRLNPAGELVMDYYRKQKSEWHRLHSQVSDLSGRRRGHINVACSQALLPKFLPEQVARYRHEHPGVTFAINVRDREQVEDELKNFQSDLAVVFEPRFLSNFECMFALPQQIHVVMAANHPLTAMPKLRLRHCLEYPHIAPAKGLGVRDMLDGAMERLNRTMEPVLESESFELMRHYVLYEQTLGFQIPISMPDQDIERIVMRPIDTADLPVGYLFLGHLKGRNLPVAVSRFADQLLAALQPLAVG